MTVLGYLVWWSDLGEIINIFKLLTPEEHNLLHYKYILFFFFFFFRYNRHSKYLWKVFHYTLACYIYSYFCIKFLLTLILFLSMPNVEKWFVNVVFWNLILMGLNGNQVYFIRIRFCPSQLEGKWNL